MSGRVTGWGLMALIPGCCCVGACTPSEIVEPAQTQQLAGRDRDVADPPLVETEPEGNQQEPPPQEIAAFEEYWPDGEIRLRRELKLNEKGEPVAHGATTRWSKSGEKTSEQWFINGINHGPRLAWYRNGQSWSVGAYQNGNPSGTWTVWDREGQPEKEWSYDDLGGYHGMLTVWHANGTKKMEVEFVHGRKQGFETMWDLAENILQEIDYGRDSDE